jgi:hypothetical protein
MRLHPSFARYGTKTFCLPHMREAERRKAPTSRRAALSDVAIWKCPQTRLRGLRRMSAARLRATNASRQANHPLAGALAFRRSTAAFVAGANAFESVKAALRAIRRAWALPAPLTALKPSTWHAGRHAGGDDARTARERSVWLRPREPPSLHFREYPRPKGPSQTQ